MLKLGLCSLTLGNLSVEEIIDLVKKADLTAIEWWGKGHVPTGNLEEAKRVGELTRQANLEVSSYGSYYKVGFSDDFDEVLATAKALQAPTIRVWAGDCNYAEASEDVLQKVIDDTIRIADLASKENISITFESHRNTFTNTKESSQLFANQVMHDNVFFSWQKVHGSTVEHSCDMIEMLAPRLSTIHLYHWTLKDSVTGEVEKYPFCEGKEDWIKYFEILKNLPSDHYILMEFVCDNTVEQFFADAEVMKSLL